MATGAQLGQNYQTVMPAMSDNADVQAAFRMVWFGDANASTPTGKGIEAHLAAISSRVSTVESKKTLQVIYSNSAPARDTANYTSWLWVNSSTTMPDGASRPVYIWNGSAWSQIAGAADPSANYVWNGNHTFNKPVTLKGGINVFADANARTAGLSGATNGTLSFVNGKYEYLNNGTWTALGATDMTVETRAGQSTNVVDSDVGKLLQFTNALASTLNVNQGQIKVGSSIRLVRTGSAGLTVNAGTGVTLYAPQKTLGPNASAMLTKIATDVWVLDVAPVPLGGLSGQVLTKASNNDYDVKWADVVTSSGGTVAMGTVKTTAVESDTIKVPSGGLIINGHRIYVDTTKPASMVQGDVWIQV